MLLKSYFGYDAFLPDQEDIIRNVLASQDTIAIMPTGGGKSLCYQLPALLLDGVTIVVSPLIALMKDQVDTLRSNGIPAAFYNSSLPQSELNDVVSQLESGKLKLLYLAPESISFLTNSFKKIKISLFAIDEAHCISSWGHDFRPAYLQLGTLKDQYSKIPFIALTATADRATREDIAAQLRIKDANTFISSFDRPNLFLDIRAGVNRKPQMLSFIKRRPNTSGIVYCLSRKGSEEIAKFLTTNGYDAHAYHAGMDAQSRTEVQENFINDKIRIVVATIAFGMGIDKSNVRWVIHYNMPKNVESYYQEIGRAGRDGKDAYTLMFHSFGDIMVYRKFAQAGANEEYELAKLERMKQVADSKNCRRRMLLSYFGEHRDKDCGNCDNCKNPPQVFDGTIIAQKICSTVYRIKEQEPVSTVVDILRGSKNSHINDNNYHKVSTYGLINDVSWLQLQDYCVQLVNQGVLEIWFHEKNRLVLTPIARKILFEGKRISLAKLLEVSAPEIVARQSEEESQRGELFEALRKLRSELAREKRVLPFQIFGDKSLEDMERQKPHTHQDFAKIFGVGNKKLQQFGSHFISCIREYCEASPPSATFVPVRQPSFRSQKSKSGRITLLERLESAQNNFFRRNSIEESQKLSQEKLERISNAKDLDLKEVLTTSEYALLGELIEKTIHKHRDSLETTEKTHLRSYRMYKEGMTVAEIAEKRGLTVGSIHNHFIKSNQEGEPLDFSPFISREEIEAVRQAHDSLENPEGIGDYFNYFEQQLTYGKIRMGLHLNGLSVPYKEKQKSEKV